MWWALAIKPLVSERGSVTMPTAPHHLASQNPVSSTGHKIIPRLALPVSVIAVRAEAYSPDDKTVVVSLTTKYSSVERTYSVPLECFHDLVDDLQRLNALTDTTSF
jgi:hypothetical protein